MDVLLKQAHRLPYALCVRSRVPASDACQIWSMMNSGRAVNSSCAVRRIAWLGKFSRCIFTSDMSIEWNTIPAPQMPPEVCEFVIDEVASSRAPRWKISETLRKCALVCRNWRHRSQMHLFRVVTIQNPSNVLSLRSLLRDAPELSFYIEQVELVASTRYTPASHGYLPGSASVLSSPLFLGQYLSTLRTLSLSSKDVSTFSAVRPLFTSPCQVKYLPHLPLHPRFPTFYSGLSQLSTLHLQSVIFPTFGDLVRLLYSFPQLQDLQCIKVFYDGTRSGDITSYGPRSGRRGAKGFLPKLKVLTLSLAPQTVPGSFKSPITGFTKRITLRDICTILEAMDSKSLEHLSIPFEVCKTGSWEGTSRKLLVDFVMCGTYNRFLPYFCSS